MVEIIEDWEYSSLKDYASLRKGNLVNVIKIVDFIW